MHNAFCYAYAYNSGITGMQGKPLSNKQTFGVEETVLLISHPLIHCVILQMHAGCWVRLSITTVICSFISWFFTRYEKNKFNSSKFSFLMVALYFVCLSPG